MPTYSTFGINIFINFLRNVKVRVWCRYLLLGETDESYLPRTIPVPCCSKLGYRYRTLFTALCRQMHSGNAIKGALTIINVRNVGLLTVLRIWIRVFLGLLDPDLLVKGTDPDPDPSIIKQKY